MPVPAVVLGTVAIAASLIQTTKIDGVEPFAYLNDVLEGVVARRTKVIDLDALLPWSWKPVKP